MNSSDDKYEFMCMGKNTHAYTCSILTHTAQERDLDIVVDSSLKTSA